jgi:hypothetical protein
MLCMTINRRGNGRLLVTRDNDALIIPYDTMMNLFAPAVNGVIHRVMSSPALLSCHRIFLVGGFGASPILR